MNLHEAFVKFDNTIKLSESHKKRILTSRNAVRNKIRNYFTDELNIASPKFKWQGSFTINTALEPIEGKEVDIDDGLYLTHINQDYPTTWPKPRDVHKLVIDALEGHTQDGCEDKTSCVRVIYKNNYHIDIPIYIMENNHAKLANKETNEWQTSDSKDFSDWYYKTRTNDQTSRLIRYLKAWRDFNDFDFSSIELTILVTNCHVQNNDDSLALKLTVEQIYMQINNSKAILKPVVPYENLWGKKTDAEKNCLIKEIEQLKNDLNSVIENKSKHRSSLILREVFGTRFPVLEDDNETPIHEYFTGPKPWRKL